MNPLYSIYMFISILYVLELLFTLFRPPAAQIIAATWVALTALSVLGLVN